MSTPLRYFQIGMPYHIYNRGNRKGNIFLDTKDYLRFLKKLKEYKEKYAIEFMCYCLMPNHFHFLLRQKENGAITKFMLSLCTSYSKYFNLKHNYVGRLFQERFRAKIVETDEYLLHLSRYIHLNPLSDNINELNFSSPSTLGVDQGRIIKKITSYPWSSYREYRDSFNGICEKNIILNYFLQTNQRDTYVLFSEQGISENDGKLINEFL